MLVESFVVDALSLVSTVAETTGIGHSGYAIEFDLLRTSVDAPLVAVDFGRYGSMMTGTLEVVPASRHVRRFHPVTLDASLPGRDEAIIDLARQVASDVLSQFGVGRLVVIPTSG